MARPVVDLPQPDSPTSPSVSPSRTSRLIPDTACTMPPCGLELHDEILDAQEDVVGVTEVGGPGAGHQAEPPASLSTSTASSTWAAAAESPVTAASAAGTWWARLRSSASRPASVPTGYQHRKT